MAAEQNGIDWDNYRVFLAVARTGSLRGASRALGISPPAVTRRIRAFEAKHRTPLFCRVQQGVELTPEGRRMLGYAEAAEAALARAALTQEATDTVEGECRIALADGMATYWLPRFLPAFARKHPNIRLLTASTTERTMAKGPSHDLQIQYADTPDESLVAQRVAMLHFMLFASRDYLEENGTPASMEDLARHRLVDFTLVGSEKGTFASWRGLSDRTMIIANSVGTQCEAIRWGAGIGMLTSYAGVVYPNLVPVVPTVYFPTPVYVCFERETAKRPAVRATLNFIKDTMFDRRRMPWFAEDFVPPDARWAAIMHQCLETRLERSQHLCPAAG